MIESFLAEEYAVALTDYEGLGESGSHPYLEPQTEAFNTIDAVRAMREITPAVSARWVAVGYSQGGQAVWAADELNSYYGNGLQLQGSVALAPSVNSTGGADLVWSGSLTDEQRASFPMAMIGGARYNPDLDADAFLHGSADYFRAQLSRCKPIDSQESTGRQSELPVPWRTVVDRLRDANDVKPDSPQDIATLRDALRRVALPQRPLDKPMLVINGEDDAQVLPDWVRFAVSGSCALGKSSMCSYRTPTISMSQRKALRRHNVGSQIDSPARLHPRIALPGRTIPARLRANDADSSLKCSCSRSRFIRIARRSASRGRPRA
jgi:pimeloyl-ACP methyl ester carboxylesterase